MDESHGGVERRLDDLAARIGAIEQRLLALESGKADGSPEGAAPAPDSLPQITPRRVEFQSDIALFGRSLIGLGGAYLLRALAESHLIPQAGSVALGIAYAALWGYLADRQARRGEPHAPTFSAGVAATVAYPLAWESAARFGILSHGMALVVILGASAGLLAVAYERRRASLAWIATGGSIASCTALVLDSGEINGPLLVIALTGAATWWMAKDRGWPAASWPSSLAAAVLAVVVAMQAIGSRGADTPDLTTLALCAVALVYGVASGARPLLRGQDLSGWDLVRAAPILVISLSGSAYLASASHQTMITVPLVLALTSAGAYFLALRRPEAGLVRTRIFFGTVAATCALTASAALTTPRAAGLVWGALAIMAAVTAPLLSAPQLAAHAALYGFCAGLGPMLLIRSVAMLTGIRTSYSLSAADLLLIAAILAATLIALTTWQWQNTRVPHLARLTLLAITCLLLVAALASLMVHWIGGDAAAGAAARSAAIAAGSVGLTFLSRVRLFGEARTLVYPLLAVGAAKFVLDDFLGGRAATLFITLAIYGLALLVVSRSRRAAPRAEPTGMAAIPSHEQPKADFERGRTRASS
jgi:hypothetical protein